MIPNTWAIVVLVSAALLVVGFTATSEKEGVVRIACSFPASVAGQLIDVAGLSQAPCQLDGTVSNSYATLGFLKFTFKSGIDSRQMPAKDMFESVGNGETPFPAEGSAQCANFMAEFVLSGAQSVVKFSEDTPDKSFFVQCTEKAVF